MKIRQEKDLTQIYQKYIYLMLKQINDKSNQTLTYMKLGNYRLGLLINFNVLTLKDGIKRIINTPQWPL